MVNELTDHIIGLAIKNDFTLDWQPWLDDPFVGPGYYADLHTRCVTVPVIETTGAYYVALHEIGHMVTPPLIAARTSMLHEVLIGGPSPERVLSECLAVIWAFGHARVWDRPMLDIALTGLRSYQANLCPYVPTDLTLVAVDLVEFLLTALPTTQMRPFVSRVKHECACGKPHPLWGGGQDCIT